MKLFFVIVINFVFLFHVMAQKGNAEQIEAIEKLHWMTGSWSGTSLVNADNQQNLTNIRETVQPALDGTILLINVWATDKDTNTNRQSLAYTAFSVISYDLKNKKYKWTTWRNSGNAYDQHDFKVGDNSFEYTTDENGGKTRYRASFSNGEFFETGEFSKNGDNWTQFITMKLQKRKS